MSAASDYFKWRHGTQVGCMFARAMSLHPADFGQVIEEISDTDAVAVAATIAARTAHFISEPSTLAAAFVLLQLNTLNQLIDMAIALGKQPRWTFGTTKLLPPPNLDLVAVRVTRELPFGTETRPSEALVMGPYKEFPNTRRAPVTAFEIFVGEPAPQDPKTHKPTTKANFAHIDFRDRKLIKKDFAQETVDTMWAQSEKGRLESLNGVNDNRAKARVAFVIPGPLAAKKGCAP